MVAIPVNSLGENPQVSEYFGKSKWFAFFDEGTISFEKNTLSSGCKIVDWLYDLGVTQTIINSIGKNPLLKLNEMDIECFYDKSHIDNLVIALEKLEENKLTKADSKHHIDVIDFINGCDEVCS